MIMTSPCHTSSSFVPTACWNQNLPIKPPSFQLTEVAGLENAEVCAEGIETSGRSCRNRWSCCELGVQGPGFKAQLGPWWNTESKHKATRSWMWLEAQCDELRIRLSQCVCLKVWNSYKWPFEWGTYELQIHWTCFFPPSMFWLILISQQKRGVYLQYVWLIYIIYLIVIPMNISG